MKKSILLVFALLVTMPAYMAFIISRSEKSPDKILWQYFYPEISSFSVDPEVAVWLVQSDTNYLYCIGCDTTGIFKLKNLKLSIWENQPWAFSVQNDNMHYQLGIKEIRAVIADNNSFHISGYKQNKLKLSLSNQSQIVIENCEFDTLFVELNNMERKDLEIQGKCNIKHMVVKSDNGLTGLYFTCKREVTIESLTVNNMNEAYFNISIPANILSAMNFKLNGKQISAGKVADDSASANKK